MIKKDDYFTATIKKSVHSKTLFGIERAGQPAHGNRVFRATFVRPEYVNDGDYQFRFSLFKIHKI